MPSYYYTFAYQLEGFSVRFIAIDAISLLPYEDKGCQPHTDGSINEHCEAPSTPTYDAQMEWLESTLNQSMHQHEYTVAFAHFPIVSTGKYGVNATGWRIFDGVNTTLDDKCGSKGKTGGYGTFTEELSNLFAKYNVQLYVSGHEHHSEMFVGNFTYYTDKYSFIGFTPIILFTSI